MPVTPALVPLAARRACASGSSPGRPSPISAPPCPDNRLYDTVYAHGTTQNHPPAAGLYRFTRARHRVRHACHTPDGTYRLDVEAADGRGNTTHGHLAVQLANTET